MLRIRVALVVMLVALVAACGGSAPSGDLTTTKAPAGPASPVPSPEAPSEPVVSGSPTVTGAPSDPEYPSVTEAPESTGEPTATGEPTGPGEPTGAEACSGSADNRDFFRDIATRVGWPVLCGVLPRGWFVADGSYRLANGGRLLVSYKGPDGASIALSQGAFCASGGGCVPSGTDLGAAPLGPLDGTLYETGDGFAIIAAPGDNPSWLMATKGLDQATTEALAAALAEVGR